MIKVAERGMFRVRPVVRLFGNEFDHAAQQKPQQGQPCHHRHDRHAQSVARLAGRRGGGGGFKFFRHDHANDNTPHTGTVNLPASRRNLTRNTLRYLRPTPKSTRSQRRGRGLPLPILASFSRSQFKKLNPACTKLGSFGNFTPLAPPPACHVYPEQHRRAPS